ncbi:MAG: hypothetical protein ACO3LE_02120 [Bdellovibrionota bacterium]
MERQKLKKIALIAIGLLPLALLIVFGSNFFIERHYKLEKARQLQEEQEALQWEYEDRFRSTMVRVYQNLRLGHMLAAYRNLENFQEPPISQILLYEEYFETIERIASGLLESRFLDESEKLWQRLESIEEYQSKAEEALVRVSAFRMYQSALRYIQNGRQLLEEKLFFESVNELKKAKLELDILKQYDFLDLKEDEVRWKELYRSANYYHNHEKAKEQIDLALKALKLKDFGETQKTMYIASGHVGKMAFYSLEHKNDQEVLSLRDQLYKLRDDLAYLLPNSIPIFNFFEKDNLDQFSSHFFLKSVDIKFDSNSPREIELDFDLSVQVEKSEFYVVRYKTYFFNGQVYFNSKLLRSGMTNLKINEALPNHLKGSKIKRVDISVYDSRHVLVSRVMQAFKKPSS